MPPHSAASGIVHHALGQSLHDLSEFLQPEMLFPVVAARVLSCNGKSVCSAFSTTAFLVFRPNPYMTLRESSSSISILVRIARSNV
jgi:hypothetical protein